MKYLNLEFGDSKTVIELNDSTVAQKWVEVFLKYKENNIDQSVLAATVNDLQDKLE